MEVYVVVTVFQGVFDDAKGFKTSKEADNYIEKLKADYNGDEDLEIRNLVLEI